MSVSVTLSEQRAFGREALTAIGGGVAAGAAAAVLNIIAGNPVPQLSALAFGLVVGLVANLADHHRGTPALRLVLGGFAGAAMAILWPINAILAGAAAGVLLGAAFVVGEDLGALESSAVASVYGFWMAAAVFVTQTLAGGIDTTFLAEVFTTTVWGLFVAFAGGLRRLEWRRDEILASFKEAEADLDGELEQTVASGRVLYEQIVQEIERVPARDRDRAQEIASETSQALIALCRRAAELRRAAERTSQRKLQKRVVELDDRIARSTDPTVRRELEATLDELLEQVKVRQRFDVARARLEARQQRCFTALERLHVALIQGAGGGQSDDTAVLESIASLEKLTDEIRWRNLSVDELCEGPGADDSDTDSDTLIASIRDALDEEAESDVSNEWREVVDEPVDNPTVLDSAAFADDGEAALADDPDAPPGTDGSLEQESHDVAYAHADRSS
jgi:hypothetical protein